MVRGLWLGTWQGKFQEKENLYLRFFDAQGNLVPIAAESLQLQLEAAEQKIRLAQQQTEALQAELARLKESQQGGQQKS